MGKSYTKKLICLANSWKTGGRCIACKEINGTKIGGWIRPVSSRPSGELNPSEHIYNNKTTVEVGDIFQMEFDGKSSHPYQVENHVITAGYYCGYGGKASAAMIRQCLDPNTALPWPMGYSTRYGNNDQVPEGMAKNAGETLRLIEVSDFTVIIEHEWPEFGNKRKVRGSFTRLGHQYKFGITDPVFRARYSTSPDGNYHVGRCILCISLGEVDRGYAYKLIATVLPLE